MGVDAAEGGDATVWTIVDEFGIIFQLSLSTINTSEVPNRTIALINKYGVPPENTMFDIGGGGKQHADQLRERGYDVRTVAFGGAPVPIDSMDGKIVDQTRDEIDEIKCSYKNKRAQMYGDLRFLVNPDIGGKFCIPRKYTETHRQLKPLPLMYDPEGKLYLPPKDKPSENFKGTTIKGILGRSPDEADSLVLAVHGMLYPAEELVAGPLF
jgi:hypothetical protein